MPLQADQASSRSSAELPFLPNFLRANKAAAPAPNNRIIGGAGTSVPPVEPPELPPLEELLDELELLLDEDPLEPLLVELPDEPLEPVLDEVPPKLEEPLLPPNEDDPDDPELEPEELPELLEEPDDPLEPLEPEEPDEPLEPDEAP